MDNPPLPDAVGVVREGETPAERAARTKREADLVAEGEAEMDAGYWLDEDEADAWLEAVATDGNAPLPPCKQRPA